MPLFKRLSMDWWKNFSLCWAMERLVVSHHHSPNFKKNLHAGSDAESAIPPMFGAYLISCAGWYISQNLPIKAGWKIFHILWCRNMASIIVVWLVYCNPIEPSLRESILKLIESLRCRSKSWGPGPILERWTNAQPWRRFGQTCMLYTNQCNIFPI